MSSQATSATPTRVCLTSAQTGWAWPALSVAAAVMGPSSGAAQATAQWHFTPCVHVMLATTWLSRRSATRLCTKPSVPSTANRPGTEIGSWALSLRYNSCACIGILLCQLCSLGCGAWRDSSISHMQQGQSVKAHRQLWLQLVTQACAHQQSCQELC